MTNNQLPPFKDVHIHGDNIVECERAFSLIQQALGDNVKSVIGPQKSIVCPQYTINFLNSSSVLNVTFYPGFGRWDHDILTSVRNRGGVLREAADVIITSVVDGSENPLFAIEFCGALPAGNQAWQRSGRAYSFGAAQIPYLYISELGGYELDANRRRKAPRMPNAAVPFSYLSFSLEKDTPVFPIFVTAPGADQDSREAYEDEFADIELLELVRAQLLQTDDAEIFERLQKKVLSFVKKRAGSARAKETLSPDQWQAAFDSLKETNGLSDFLTGDVRQGWSKTAYIDALTDKAKTLMQKGSAYGIGLTGTKLPMCLFDKDARANFVADIKPMFPKLDKDFLNFLDRKQSLAVCWVMGFKPRGDDARPDRGLPPLTRMLIGPTHDMLTIVYGPAPKTTWETLENNPSELPRRNGLWEAIMETTDALLVESSTDSVSKNGYIRDEWKSGSNQRTDIDFFVSPQPNRFGENDVDTALHLLLSQMSGTNIFEGMCNPPGGDWSGVSVLNNAKQTEYRWLSLPRVSGSTTKRPDHVFQLFMPGRPLSTIISIESKETPRSLETGIGPRLTAYIHYLLSTPASIERPFETVNWQHSSENVFIKDYIFTTAGAFLYVDDEQVIDAVNRSNTDLSFAVKFSSSGESCEILVYSSTTVGREIAEFLAANVVSTSILKISLQD